jgi:hypothetical protein
VLRLHGRIQVEHVSTVKEVIAHEKDGVALDLEEVTLIGRDAVNFLADCEPKGIELRNCPAFLREWVAKEQQRITAETPNKASRAINGVEDL